MKLNWVLLIANYFGSDSSLTPTPLKGLDEAWVAKKATCPFFLSVASLVAFLGVLEQVNGGIRKSR